MNSSEIIAELKTMATEPIKKIMSNHGAPPSQLGVKIEDMKKIQKRIKKDYALSLELYNSGVPEAQYLAGLIADENKMTKKDLEHWVKNASWHMVGEYTVPWIAAESNHGWDLATIWIDHKDPAIRASGWNTLSSLVAIRQDEDLDIKVLKDLLKRVEKEVHTADNRERYSMNQFVISVGGYVNALSAEALRVAKANGKLTVNMGNTACKVPFAPDYITKMLDKGIKKRKMARC